MTAVLDTNAMWDTIRDHAQPSTSSWDHGALQIGAPSNDPDWWRVSVKRTELSSRYAWTITSPDAVAFAAAHAGPALIDPMAGTGWWAHLLTQAGVDVTAYDLYPPSTADNHWHRDPHLWHPVTVMDGAQAVAQHGHNRTLLLSWPPYDDPAGADILNAYPGPRVIYIGENAGGCCGDDRLHDLLGQDWIEIAGHRPVQWYGIHDYITVYDRTVPKE